MVLEYFGMVRYDLGPLLGQMRIAKLKSAYNSLIVGPRNFGLINRPTGNRGLGILMWSYLTMDPSFKVKRG